MYKNYFTSDLHLGHPMMARRRGFDSVDEMNQALIDGINSVVTFNDQLWILGDFSYRISKEEARELLKLIRCRHIHLINGNHDKAWKTEDGFESVEDYHKLKVNSQKIILCHYPLISWDGKYHGSDHFYGHVHGDEWGNRMNVYKNRRAYDVGVDANPNKPYRPESLEEISNRMKAWSKEKQDMTYSIRAAWSEDDHCYLASVPEIPGCVTVGVTPEEAVWNLRNIIDIQLEGCMEDDRPIPEPRHYDLVEEMNCEFWHRS